MTAGSDDGDQVDVDELRAFGQAALASVVLDATDRNYGGAAAHIEAVCRRYGAMGAYVMAVAMAVLIIEMGSLRSPDENEHTVYGFEVFDEQLDEVINPDRPASEDRGMRRMVTAMRFVSAVLNRDQDQQRALFDSIDNEESAAGFMAGMMELVGIYGRYRRDLEARSQQ